MIVLGALVALCWETDREAEIGPGDLAPETTANVSEPDGQRPTLRGAQSAPAVGASAVAGDAAPLAAAEADRPTHELVVTVRDVDGRPVEGAHVNVSGSIRPASGPFGDFDVEIAGDLFGEDEDDPVAPRPDVNARTDAGGVARLDVAVATDHRVRAECDDGIHDVRVKTPSGPGTTEVLIELRPGFRLSGSARRPDGRPVAAARVWVSAPVPGAHTILVRRALRPGDGRVSCWYEYKPWSAGSTGINLTLPKGIWARISLIDDSSGEAAPFRKGVVHGVQTGQTPLAIYRTFNEAEDRTSLDVPFPAPGDYELRVHWVDRRLAAEQTVRVTAAKDQTFELRAR